MGNAHLTKVFAGETLTPELIRHIDTLVENLQTGKKEVGRSFLGHDLLVDGVTMALISGGHALLTGVPGVGKTVLASSMGQVFGMTEKRIQGTPDLMPSDILGSEVLEEDLKTGERKFRFIKGPVFNQLLMTDELNRASPRTQSALLQAMQEGKVTIGNETYFLPRPFFVIATQNPLDQEGTNPLPEAQKDRFIAEFAVVYPSRAVESEIMMKTTGTQHSLADIFGKENLAPPENLVVSPKDLRQVMTAAEVIRAQHFVRKLPLGQKVSDAILDIVRSSRPEFIDELKNADPDLFNYVNYNVKAGPGTRALQSFSLLSRARAVMNGTLTPSIDDVLELAQPILRHRLESSINARSDLTNPQTEKIIIDRIADKNRYQKGLVLGI